MLLIVVVAVFVAAKHVLCLFPPISYTFIRSNSILINDNLRCDATQSEIEAKTICGTWLTDRQQSYFDCSIRHFQYVSCIFISSLRWECWKKAVWEGEREKARGLRHVTGGMTAPTVSLSFHAKTLNRKRAAKLKFFCVHCHIYPIKTVFVQISRNKNKTKT